MVWHLPPGEIIIEVLLETDALIAIGCEAFLT
jgi:hypothetical protein